jgi:1-aminocyclopropane-1-carboxylate deaminase/D-cysteine desulfhydrase-like pyridoxal-dependent ACC family enzyme
LWLKRDDRNASVAAGNKLRALEFLLGAVAPGDLVLTGGGQGSTHVYATAVHASRLGAEVISVVWPQEMHSTAHAVARAAAGEGARITRAGSSAAGVVRLTAWQLGMGRPRERLGHRGVWVLPAGGSSPLGVLGHVNAGLELANQISRGEVPEPAAVVVPLGSGGTAAGLALGFGVAGLRTTVVGVRVVPWIAGNRLRLERLLAGTRHLIRRRQGRHLPLPSAPVVIEPHYYGGAYGRPLAAGEAVAALFRHAAVRPQRDPVVLDPTYAAKAGAAALALAREPHAGAVMLWLTFDARALEAADTGSPVHPGEPAETRRGRGA